MKLIAIHQIDTGKTQIAPGQPFDLAKKPAEELIKAGAAKPADRSSVEPKFNPVSTNKSPKTPEPDPDPESTETPEPERDPATGLPLA